MHQLRERLRQMRVYGHWLIGYAPGLLASCLFVGIVASALEGIGLFLLVPILGQLGLGSDGAAGSIVTALNGAITYFGLAPSLESQLAMFFLLMLLKGAVSLIQSELNARLSSGFLVDLRVRTYRALTGASWLYLARLRSSTFAHALTTQAEQVASGARIILRLIANGLSTLTSVAVVLVLSPGLTLAAIGAGILIVVPMTYFDLRAYRLGTAGWQVMQGIYEQLSKHFSGLKAARALSAEQRYREDFESLARQHARTSLELSRNAAITGFIHSMTAAIMICALIYLSVKSGASTAEPVLLAIVFSRLLPRFQMMQYDVQELMSLLPQEQGLRELIAAANASREAPGEPVDRLSFLREITLSHISFNYGEEEAAVIDDLSLTIPAKGSLGLLGTSGAGKTTLADIITGLLYPTSGEFMIDGKRISKDEAARWRRSVAYVTQEEFLFHGTIRENLTLVQQGATDAELWSALEQANAARFVRSQPRSLDTLVGDRGAQLSRGQRQRLCLARALLGHPSLLVLDEATSALNPLDEADIITALRRLSQHMAVFVIAHRLSSVSWADRLAVLAHGRIVESGPLEELMQTQDGLVRAMAAIEPFAAEDN